MLFAQTVSPTAEIVGAIANLGAVGIIGVFMLRILPMIAMHLVNGFRDGVVTLGGILKAERDSYEIRCAKITEEIRKLSDQGGCRYQP